ncbi:TonB-dependent receptor domain-containing protein [Pendulispora albinea]|uniref:TonB-dependent receptor n=1 Tax=Pendulispora albinea TaxID=2741071 RepID=A0ABZ2LTF6_9BACT
MFSRDRFARLSGCFVLAIALLSARARAHDVEPPKPLEQPIARWPGRPELHDVVVPVELVVDVEGKVTDVRVEEHLGPAFDTAAIEAARAWRFVPGMRDGKPVATRVRAAVRFLGALPEGATSAPTAPAGAAPASHGATSAPPAVSASPAAASPSSPQAASSSSPAAASSASAPAAADDPRGIASVRVQGQAPARTASDVVRGRDVIDLAPHRTGSDLLQLVPGVFITQHSGEGKAHQIFLRGYDAVHGQDLELWVGGIPINEVSNIHGQGYADLHFVMPEVVKQVEATPGPYDPRQGDFAVAGSVRMRLGYDEPGVTAKGSLGSFGSRRLFLAYHPKGAPDETFAAFEDYSTDGFGPNRAARRSSLMAQMAHDFGDGVALRLLATTYTGRFDSAGVLRESDIDAHRIDRFGTYDPKQGGSSARTQLLTELHKDTEGGRWSIAPFVVFRSLTLRQNFTGYLADSVRGGKKQLDSDNSQQIQHDIMIGATASYRKPLKLFSSRDAIEAGFFGRNDWIDQSQRRLSQINDTPTETLVDATIRATDVAGYLDASLHPISHLALRGGIRVDSLSYSAEDRAIPGGSGGGTVATASQSRTSQSTHVGKKITADYAIFPSLHALASYGEGFRSPQARSLSDGQNAPFTKVKGYEAGLRLGDGKYLQGSLAAFHTSLNEDLVFDPLTARNEIVPGTERNGVTAEVTMRPNSWFVYSGSFTYARASFTGSNTSYGDGDLLPYVPQIVVRSDIGAKRTIAHFFERDLVARIGTGIDALVRRPLPYGEFGKNVFLVDATAALRLKELELSLDVYNLLDASWFDGQFVYASNFDRSTTPSLIPARHVTVGPPRTFFVSLGLYL